MSVSINRKNILRYTAFVLVNIYYGLSETILYSSKCIILLLASMALFLVHICFESRYNLKKLFFIIVLLGIFAYNYYVTKDSRILALIITIIGVRGLELKKVLKIMFYEKITLTVIVMAMSFVGFRNYYAGRAVLGFSHGNLLMLTIIGLILMYLCIYWEKINMIQLSVMFVMILLAFFITKSRTGTIIGVVVWLLTVGCKYFNIKKLLRFLGKYLPFILMFLSLYLPLSTKHNVFIFLDKIPGAVNKYREIVGALDNLLSHRFTLANLILSHTKINLLGSNTDMQVLSIYRYLVVDSGYVQLLLVFGIVGSIIFIVLNYFMVKELIKRQQYIYIVAFIAMALYAFTENSWCSLKYNFTLLFFIQFFQPDVRYEFLELLKKKLKKKKLKVRLKY